MKEMYSIFPLPILLFALHRSSLVFSFILVDIETELFADTAKSPSGDGTRHDGG